MINKTLLIFLFLLGAQLTLHSQHTRNFNLAILPTFGDSTLVLNKVLNADSLQISALRFYLSDFQLFSNNQKVWAEANSYYLVDAEQPTTCQLSLKIPNDLVFDSLICHLGIDSLTNTEGAKSGDLDPTNGMYWAWQSGYINFKLEGASRLCPTRKKQFQFHLGGFLDEHYALQTLGFSSIKKTPQSTQNTRAVTHNSQFITHNSECVLHFDVAQFLSNIDFKTTNHIMSPSVKAVGLAKKAAAAFSFQF